MKQEKINAVVEGYLNGNVADTKKAVKSMSKSDFISFLELMRGNGFKPYQLRHLVE